MTRMISSTVHSSARSSAARRLFNVIRSTERTDIGFGAVLPDVAFTVLGPYCDRLQLYDVADRRKPFWSYIDRLAEFGRSRDARHRRELGNDDIERVAQYLRSDFDLIRSLDAILDGSEQELLRLTEDQFVVLDALGSDCRVFIGGPSESGKTVLAVQAAWRSARRGDRVLLTCYDRLLADKL